MRYLPKTRVHLQLTYRLLSFIIYLISNQTPFRSVSNAYLLKSVHVYCKIQTRTIFFKFPLLMLLTWSLIVSS